MKRPQIVIKEYSWDEHRAVDFQYYEFSTHRIDGYGLYFNGELVLVKVWRDGYDNGAVYGYACNR